MARKGKIILNIILAVVFLLFLLGSIFYLGNIFIGLITIIVFLLIFLIVNASSFFNKEFFAIIFMSIAVYLGFQSYSQVIPKHFLFFKWNETVTASIKPDLQSTIMAILLYASVVIRRIGFSKFATPKGLIITCLNVLFCASFLNVFFPTTPWNIPIINISSQSFLWIAIGLSWLGMSAIAGFVWIGLFIIAVFRLSNVNIAMGTAGIVYILSAFSSIGIQLSGINNIKYIMEDLMLDFSTAGRHLSADMNSSVSFTRKDKIEARK